MQHSRRFPGRTRRLPTSALASLLASLGCAALFTGCASQHAMEDAALRASDQVAALKIEVEDQIDAEIEFYDRNMAAMSEAIASSRSLRLRRMITSQAETFVTTNAEQPLSNEVLVELAQTAVQQWQATDQPLQQTLSQVTQDVTSNRQQVRVDLGQLDSLQAKLHTLGQARNTRQLAGFIFNFLDTTADDYLKLRDSTTTSEAESPPAEPQGAEPQGDDNAH